jgi:hypothetical protein
VLARVEPDPGVARTMLGERQQARHQPGRHPCVGIFKGRHVEPHGSAEWRWLDSNALKRLQEIENDHPCDRRLPRRSHGAFKQRIVTLDKALDVRVENVAALAGLLSMGRAFVGPRSGKPGRARSRGRSGGEVDD